MRALLLYDVQGVKYDGAIKSTVIKFLSGSRESYSHINVPKGELLINRQPSDDRPFNFHLFRDPNVLLFCEADNVAPLGEQEFLLLEPIKSRSDRLEVFNRRFEWAMALKEGSSVDVTIPGDNISVPVCVRATVHYRGEVEDHLGTFFGVEILVSV